MMYRSKAQSGEPQVQEPLTPMWFTFEQKPGSDVKTLKVKIPGYWRRATFQKYRDLQAWVWGDWRPHNKIAWLWVRRDGITHVLDCVNGYKRDVDDYYKERSKT